MNHTMIQDASRRVAVFLATALAAASPFATADDAALAAALASQPAKVQARFEARHPAETLKFFGIEPGMTVVEALPGGGWYSKLLLAYLGPDGKLIGADYALDMFPKFNFYDDAFLEAKKTWVETWVADARGWSGDDGAAAGAFVLGSMPESMAGTADAFLFIRALHNLARFEDDGGYLTAALADAKRVLKPGGILGVVQHMAPATATASWADGSRGYLKKAFVVARLTAAGFEFVGESPANLNPKDQPAEDEVVWRLPPALYGVDDPALIEKYQAIGESNRMTLLFRKPAS